jgi:DNA mismatch repair protein MutS2
VKVSDVTLEKLAFDRVREALADRTASALGTERVLALSPTLTRDEIAASLSRIGEVVATGDLSLGGVHDVRPLVEEVRQGRVLEGQELLEIAYTLDAAGTIKRAILSSERPALSELARQMGSFDGALRLVREQLDADGNVRDGATPKLREIRRRLNPLRERIRQRLQNLLQTYSAFVQDAFITLRRDRYVIPVVANFQAKVPGIALDSSDSGATVFIEPQAVVPMNNELALLEFEERDEVRRILIALGNRLAGEPGLEETLEILGQLDLVAASARLAKDWHLIKPSFNEDGVVRLSEVRHPLVESCVPNTIELDGSQRLLVVTGPNAGGKTVLIKTLGLAVLMAHAGLFVAADAESRPNLPFVESLLTDIGDEQSIEASLSTYAGHLTNLKAIVEEANERVLILVDELGSGTDPAEGAALSQAILETILASGARGLITTHLAPLKVFASETDGVRNAAMRFDVERLRPTFQLVVGQPGRSYALSIADRIGLSGDLLGRAAELLGPEGERLETLLEVLESQREALEEDVLEARMARDEAVEEAQILRRQIETLRQKEAEVIAAAAERADEMLQHTLQQAKELKRAAVTDPQRRSRALDDLQQLRRSAQQRASEPPKRVSESEPEEEYRPGAQVRVASYGAEGPIIEVRGDGLVVQLGLLKVEVSKKEAVLVKRPLPTSPQTMGVTPSPRGTDEELNIRGERVEPALEKVRDYVLEAHALRLRDAVRTYLRNEKKVERYEDAVPYEGGHGVTVAYLRI